MPYRAPRLCRCGNVVPNGVLCACQVQANRDRRARHDRHRPSARARGYNHEWRKARTAYLAMHLRCVRCGKPATVVDHITPHKGNDRLFWDRTNWQPLCASCHSKHKQREERRNAFN